MPYKDPEKQKAYQRRYQSPYQKKRYEKAAQELRNRLGGKCIECGSTENLHFDHINENEKEFSIMRLWKLRGEKMDAELTKCRLLCEPCHIKRHNKKVRK